MTLFRERNGIFFISAEPILTINPGKKQCKGHRVRKEYVDESGIYSAEWTKSEIP